jgi:hypothetical protein
MMTFIISHLFLDLSTQFKIELMKFERLSKNKIVYFPPSSDNYALQLHPKKILVCIAYQLTTRYYNDRSKMLSNIFGAGFVELQILTSFPPSILIQPAASRVI